MIYYIPISSLDAAKEVSLTLYKLSRPTPDPDDGTLYLYNWVVHPVSKEVRLACDDEPQPIHEKANENALDSILDEFINKGKLKGAEKAAVQKSILSAKKKRLVLYDILPAFWKDSAKSKDQLKAEGWYNSNKYV